MKLVTAQAIYDAGYCVPQYDDKNLRYIWLHGEDKYATPHNAEIPRIEGWKVFKHPETGEPLVHGMYGSLLVAKLDDIEQIGEKLN